MATLTAALLVGGASFVTPAVATSPTAAPVVAVLDSGVNPQHQEFDYGGATSTSDQFVGWWDFTTGASPAAGQTWDPVVTEPYDDFGHGTMSAAMAGARMVSASQTPVPAPGTKLAIGKVIDSTGGIALEALPAAIRWAVDTVDADVVNISIGAVVPMPGALYADALRAIAYARSEGVLVTVANGNGFGGALVPGDPGWASPFACSPYALSVGGTEADTVYGTAALALSTDPELVAPYNVSFPASTGTTGYSTGLGSSASAPWVAGFAASLISSARTAGTPLPVDQLETLLKHSTTDLGLPPQFQGYGGLSLSSLPAARAHAAAGTLPGRPEPDLSGTYVESGTGTLRTAWCESLLVM